MRHFSYVDIAIQNIAGTTPQRNWTEDLHERFMDNYWIWEYQKDYISDHIEAAKTIIEELLDGEPLTNKEMSLFKDEINSDLLRSLSDAYGSNCENGAFKDITNLMQNNDCFHTSSYLVDDKGIKTEHLYEAESVRFYITRKDFMDRFFDAEQNWAWCENKIDRIDGQKEEWEEQIRLDHHVMDWKHFDYHGCRFDFEGWEEYLRDYCESYHDINNYRKIKYFYNAA